MDKKLKELFAGIPKPYQCEGKCLELLSPGEIVAIGSNKAGNHILLCLACLIKYEPKEKTTWILTNLER